MRLEHIEEIPVPVKRNVYQLIFEYTNYNNSYVLDVDTKDMHLLYNLLSLIDTTDFDFSDLDGHQEWDLNQAISISDDKFVLHGTELRSDADLWVNDTLWDICNHTDDEDMLYCGIDKIYIFHYDQDGRKFSVQFHSDKKKNNEIYKTKPSNKKTWL